VLLLSLLSTQCAQALCQEAAEAPEPTRGERAIADYERAKQASGSEVLRARALMWLGAVEDDAVTDYLRSQLAEAGDGAHAAEIVAAIARVPRPALRQELCDTLQRRSASVRLRRAAARAIAQLGDRGVDLLIDYARGADVATQVRDAAIVALIDSGSDRAHRGLAPLLLQGTASEQVEMLRRMEVVHGVYPVSAARIRLVKEGELLVAATAWRQLAAEGHERARSLTIDVLERLWEMPPPPVAAQLIGGIVRVRDRDLYPLLLRYGSIEGPVVRQAVRNAAPFAASDRPLIDWLVTKGLDSQKPGEREVAKLLLADAPADAVQPLLEKVRAELRSGRKKSLDLAISLHPVLARDPSWAADLLRLVESAETEVRVVGLSLLLELGSDVAIVQAQRAMGHSSWELRSISYRYLSRCRDVGSIPLLIARVGREDGRLGRELNDALFAHTGTRCWSQGEWKHWWEKNRTGFVLPHADTVGGSVDAGSGVTIAYHGIPVITTRAAFLIDTSGSMNERMSTDRNFTRLDGAKEELTKVLTAMSPQHSCNLIAYATQVHPIWSELRRIDEGNRKEVLDYAKVLRADGGTNIFGALMAAFTDSGVDTIFLLTDGEPSVGDLIDPAEIRAEVRRQNHARQIVIHCIGLGVDSELLRGLAADSGGVYKFVK
jgi:hypothetical protein